MRISITRSGENCWTHSINEDVTTTELVELWRGGAFISAQPAETNSSKARSKLDCADMVMVAINLARLSIEHVLQFHFTQRYLTAAAYESKGTGLCFLAFKLSKTSKDGRHVSMVMKGLETLYAGAQAHGSVLQSFGSERLDTFLTPDGGLSVKAEKMLAKLGKETRAFSAMHYRTAGLPRSQINIDPDSVLRLMDGYEELPERLASNTPVFCPVHADHKPQALLIHEKGGAPVVVCRCCNRSYGLDRTRRYDFGFFDRV